jgi:uncharacterized protein (TIGR00297 family)
MLGITEIAVVLILCTVLSLISYKFGLLTASGSAASFAMGAIIGIFGSIGMLFLLIIFALMGFLVTKWRFEAKKARGLQEGKKGERTWKNVVANGLVPALIVVIAFLLGQQGSVTADLLYLCALAVAAADTTASELGVLSPNAYLITSFKKVPAGTDGGVSAFGTLCAFLASVFVAVAGWLLVMPGTPIDWRILVPMTMGVAGCMVDSLIGATLETWKLMSKLTNNISSMAIGALLGLAILALAA